MRYGDQLKIDIITKVAAGLINQKVAAKLLGKSRRTVIRYLKSYREKGPLFLIHGNKGKPGPNRIPNKIKERIMNLIIEKYYDFSVYHAWECLKEENVPLVSYRTLRRWYKEKNFLKRRKTRRKKIHQVRYRMPQTGLLLQMDGTYGKFFGQKDSCLIAAIDDANGEIPYAEFFHAETTLDCMKVIYNIIKKFGIFNVLYVDRAGVFGGNKRNNFCQLEEACKKIGIQILYAYSPQAKGRIERVWRTIKGRLIPELRIKKITTRVEANQYLHNIFLPKFNEKFTVVPDEIETSYRKVEDYFDLWEIFCTKEIRHIRNDHTISYQSQTYTIVNPEFNMTGFPIEIRTYQNREVKYFFRNKEIAMKKFIKNKKVLNYKNFAAG